MNRWILVPLLSSLVAFAACGEDVTKDDPGTRSQDCPEGQRWNPVLSKCEDEFSANNGATNGANNGTSGNNNGTANNGDNNGNNGTTGNNNGTVGNNGTTGNNGTSGNNETNNRTVPMLECGMGSLRGKTCAPSGEPLAAADVTITGVDCDGNAFEMTTRTTGDGTFEFDSLPSGQHDMKVSTGSFESTSQVFIQKDQLTDLSSAADKVCLDQNVEIAVIKGAYDHVEGVLDTLNLDYDIKGDDSSASSDSLAFLQDANAMAMYDLVFINCGELEQMLVFQSFLNPNLRANISNNLRTFVMGGGSLYVSDWSAPLLEAAFPDVVDFYGDDTSPQAHRQGYAPQTITADVLTTDLQGIVGGNTAMIEFPHDPDNGVFNNNWAVATAAGAGAVAHLSGTAQLCDGSSQCSGTSGTQADTPLLVTFKDPTSEGTVVFTSFHNERQAALNQDMERILRYLIFQL